jgi:hypothetical protein
MKNFVRLQWFAVATLLAMCAFVSPSFGDSETVSGSTCSTCNGYAFQATLTPDGGGNYSLSYTITNTNTTGSGADARDWSLTIFKPGGAVSSVSDFAMSNGNQASYTFDPGKADNGGNCSDNQQYALCVSLNSDGTPSAILPGKSLTFTADFTCPGCTEQQTWDFLSGGNCVGSNGNCYAVTQNGTPTAMPEPSTPILLGCSLLVGLGMLAFPRVRRTVFPAVAS